ncbi:hypothetical protein NL501_30160, partial [Klebsiella pneumoniae]|nr:hypothetical protein [Klebsiella pneumoniae]
FFSNAWGNLKGLENWLLNNQQQEISGKLSSPKYNSHSVTSCSTETEKVGDGELVQDETDLSEWLVSPQEPCGLEKPENGGR